MPTTVKELIKKDEVRKVVKQNEDVISIKFKFNITEDSVTYDIPELDRVVIDARTAVLGTAYICYDDRSGMPMAASKVILNPFVPKGSLVPVRETRFKCTKCEYNEVSSILEPKLYKHERGEPLCPVCSSKGIQAFLRRIRLREIIPEGVQEEIEQSSMEYPHYWPDAIPRIFKIYKSDIVDSYDFREQDDTANKLKEYYEAIGYNVIPYNASPINKYPECIIAVLPKGVNTIDMNNMTGYGIDLNDKSRGWKINIR